MNIQTGECDSDPPGTRLPASESIPESVPDMEWKWVRQTHCLGSWAGQGEGRWVKPEPHVGEASTPGVTEGPKSFLQIPGSSESR